LKNLKKQLFISILSIFFVLTLFSGCAEYHGQTNDPAESISDNIGIVSYCAKETSEENHFIFNYPQFKATVPNAETINLLIVEFVEKALQVSDGEFKGNIKDSVESWEWDENEYTLAAMDISYNITRNDSDYFSVTFEGDFNNKKAAHPGQFFYALTIDKNDEKIIFVDDLYHIDDAFVKIFQRKDKIREGLEKKYQALPEDISDDFIEDVMGYFTNTNEIKECFTKNNEYSYPFFLTDEAVGISISIPHVIGDHFEILISYEELQQFAI